MKRICLLLFIFLGGQLFAQNVGRQQLVDNSAMEYRNVADKQSVLYYGKEQDVYQRTINHPYLIDAQHTKARLSYSGVIYPEVMLRLDLYRDELIVQSSFNRNIVLVPENVGFAEMHGRNIIYFRSDSLRGSPSSGYYTLLHSGKCKVLERQVNRLTHNDRQEFYYYMTTSFYLYKEDVYYIIRSQRGLLKALGSHKKELKRFISANHLRFRDNTEIFLVKTINEYEKLSGSL